MRRLALRRTLGVMVFAICLSVGGNEGRAGESASTLYPPGSIRYVEISPSGEWIIAYATHSGANGLLAQNTKTGAIVNVFATRIPVRRIDWVAPDTLIAEYEGYGQFKSYVFRFRLVAGRVEFDEERIAASGSLVDPLPLDSEKVVWHAWERGKPALWLVDIDQLTARGRRTARPPGTRLARLDGHIWPWITDKRGRPRAVKRREEDEVTTTILARAEDEDDFHEIHRYEYADDEDEMDLLGLMPDGKNLIVTAYNGRDTKGLHELDPATGEIVETLFVRDDVDVADIIVDPISRELISAQYMKNGEARYHYFESYGKNLIDDLRAEYPGQSVVVLSSSADRRHSVFHVSGTTNPGAYYFHDARTGRSTLVAEYGPSIDRDALSSSTSFVAKSEDGTEIEAYLTLPSTDPGEPAPLVVMPHGGPIDIRDSREYDPLVQYLASWGFAVLQPNYRGSSGYGLKFIEAGKKEWARGIEDDIDAAVDHARALPEIDADRICIVGASYGGFSAIASVVRHKNRYRCAISWNGVSDIPLLADSSDMADSKRVMLYYEKFIGDLESERDKLVAASPAYHVKEIETPILIVYGTADRRVDQDHSHRMLLMLETYGKEHESMEIEGMQHGYTRDEWIDIARAVRRYLTTHLLPGEEFRSDAGQVEVESSTAPEESESPR